jgi:predicted ferric reductase
MTFTTILVTIITGIAIATMQAFINISIKFAPTADHAKKQAMRIVLLSLFVLSQVLLAWILLSEFWSAEPLTRHSLLKILIASFGLFHTYVFWIYRMLYGYIDRIVRILEKHTDLILEDKKKP